MVKIKSLLSGAFIATIILTNQVFADNTPIKSDTSKTTQTTIQKDVEIKKSLIKDLSDPIILVNKVNINTATASEIQQALTGIGEKKAIAIVAYRQENGNFTDIEQLTEVKGIGKATLEKNKDRIIL